MPVERRDILFNYSEIMALVTADSYGLGQFLPKGFETASIIEAHLARSFGKLFHDTQKKFADIYMELGGQEAALFRVRKYMRGGNDQSAVFAIPEATIVSALVSECRNKKIILPRASRKVLIAGDMYVGIQLILEPVEKLTLEI